MKYHSGVHVHTITEDDVGQRYIVYGCDNPLCRHKYVIDIQGVMGNVMPFDVGKCIHWVNPEDIYGPRIYQVENDEQRAKRLAGEIGCRGVSQ